MSGGECSLLYYTTHSGSSNHQLDSILSSRPTEVFGFEKTPGLLLLSVLWKRIPEK